MDYGVERIYHPHDGMELGLEAMIRDLVERTEAGRVATRPPAAVDRDAHAGASVDIAAMISSIEENAFDEARLGSLRKEWQVQSNNAPVIGITGTGGAGKSSVTDEILNRFLSSFPDRRVAVLAVDPTRRRTGGALLGDRIRMNSLRSERIYMRSIATRRQHLATSEMLGDQIRFLRSLAFDLIIVETAGIGQSDSEIVDLVDFSVYVMTSDYGAASQLEKIDMLDFADLVVLNKFDKRGAEDALRDVRKQWKRNRLEFSMDDDEVPVYPTIASQFNDPGVTWMFSELCRRVAEKGGLDSERWQTTLDTSVREPRATATIPGSRIRYLAEIAENGRRIETDIGKQAEAASHAQHVYESLKLLEDPALPAELELYAESALTEGGDKSLLVLRQRYQEALSSLSGESLALLKAWPERKAGVRSERYSYTVRGREISGENYRESLSRQKIPKIAAPDYRDWGELLRFLSKENLPGAYPYTGGVYPYRRAGEDPTRMFAGEGTPERTNRRFHYLSLGQPAARLSTAFDSVTLYGEDPHERPDIFGKVGNSGVSIATVDDMKKLYSGFDLCAPGTSVSMTINGPAPMILAFFMNTAIDQQVEKHLRETGGMGCGAEKNRRLLRRPSGRVLRGRAARRQRRAGSGLLGISGDKLVDARPTSVFARQRCERARHRTGGHPQGRPGAEHLHFLDRVCDEDDGRRAAVLHRQQRAQLLQRLDQRLPHCRGRREPDQPARVHARQRFYDRRVLPGARHGHRRVCA